MVRLLEICPDMHALSSDTVAPPAPPVAAQNDRLQDPGDRIAEAATLLESARLLSELLRFVAPDIHARTSRVTGIVECLSAALDVSQSWEFEVAARLSHIGCLALPEATRAAAGRGEVLSEEDDRAVASHPLVARDLLLEVRRLAGVREMIARQREPFCVGGAPQPDAPGDRITLGAQLLRVAGDYDDLVSRGMAGDAALESLRRREGEYDTRVLDALWSLRSGAAAVTADCQAPN
jgi:response regulator RpfG family c-di-GMP phosphodiesterase